MEQVTFVGPKREIFNVMDMGKWQKSQAYRDYLGFISTLNESVKRQSSDVECSMSQACKDLISLLDTLEQWINDFPPAVQDQRFGNKSYRDWHNKLNENVETLIDPLLPENYKAAAVELKAYLVDGFGNATRIDYGTGHEASFIAFLCCLYKLKILNGGDDVALVAKVFTRYLKLMRELQTTYRMEPAGSQGVWGLDDFQFVPFIWGSSQLIDHPMLTPNHIPDDQTAEREGKSFLFFSCIHYIHTVKSGPFAEHSNTLWGISSVPYWSKVNSGLIKMYKAEGVPQKDVKIRLDAPSELLLDKHVEYIKAYEEKTDDYEYIMTEYLRMSGIYWGLTAMALMRKLDVMNKDGVISFLKSCQHECGGFSASAKHDPHLLYTLSAVQILSLYDEISVVDCEGIVKFVQGLQQEDGSFYGDKWGEVDSRFSFCALACLSLLGRLDAVDVDKAVDFIVRCMNFDGGFGSCPGSESHAGQIYCCVGALSITHSLHHVNADLLGWWLCERQLPSGGLNGRPEKLPDVCYSWWVLASLKIIGRISWIDKEKLSKYILASQDEETGGISDRPGDWVDPFHTLFGIAGLSLLGHSSDMIEPVNPVFCMPESCIQRLGVRCQVL